LPPGRQHLRVATTGDSHRLVDDEMNLAREYWTT
jgi:hypothetical protein